MDSKLLRLPLPALWAAVGFTLSAAGLRGDEPPGRAGEALPGAAVPAAEPDENIPDGFRKVESSRLGVAVLCPAEWTAAPIRGAALAFALQIPVENPADAPPFVLCELSHAPADLDEYRRRIAVQGKQARQQPQQGRRLLANELIEPAADGPPFRMLEVDWEYADPAGGTLHQFRRFVIHGNYLYTFTLGADVPALRRHRDPFRSMVETSVFGPVETGLERRDAGYWVQKEHGFGMKLPEGWRPSYLPTDDVLFSAVGVTTEVFSDTLLVTSSPAGEIPFDRLKETLPDEIERARENTQVVRCEIVEAGGLKALETVIETAQGPFEFTIIERRIQGQHANYEARFTLLRKHHAQRAAEFTKTLDSFREFEPPKERRRL